jgi:hypothetical protein
MNDMPPAHIVPISQLDNDPIDYASSMTSAYQHDELDDGKNTYFKSFERSLLNSRHGCGSGATGI